MPAFPRQRFRSHPATGADGPGRFGVPEAPRSRGRPIIVRRRGPDGGKTIALRAGAPAPEGGVGAGDLHARGTGPQVRAPGAGDPLPGTSGRREAGPTVAEREGLRRRSAPCWRLEPRAPPPGRPAMRPPPPASGQGRGFGHEAEPPGARLAPRAAHASPGMTWRDERRTHGPGPRRGGGRLPGSRIESESPLVEREDDRADDLHEIIASGYEAPDTGGQPEQRRPPESEGGSANLIDLRCSGASAERLSAPPSRVPPSHDDRGPGKPGRFRTTLRARRIGHGVTSDRCTSPEPGDGPACPPRPAPAPGSRSRGGVPGLHPPNPGKSLR